MTDMAHQLNEEASDLLWNAASENYKVKYLTGLTFRRARHPAKLHSRKILAGASLFHADTVVSSVLSSKNLFDRILTAPRTVRLVTNR